MPPKEEKERMLPANAALSDAVPESWAAKLIAATPRLGTFWDGTIACTPPGFKPATSQIALVDSAQFAERALAYPMLRHRL